MNKLESLEKTSLLIKNHTYYSKIENLSEDDDNDEEDDELYDFEDCSICFEKMNNEDIIVLNCGHKFHKYCIDSWIKINPICPYCREYMSDHFECSIKTNFLSKKCKIYVDENKFSNIIIDVYTAFIDKPTKQYIIPTTFIKSVENKDKYCFLYFKESNKSNPIKYTFKFSNSNKASQLTDKITKIFDKFYDFYKSSQII